MISNRRGACVELRRKTNSKLNDEVTSVAVSLMAACPSQEERLAPPPDFRYIGLDAGPRVTLGYLAGLLGATATVGAGLAGGFGSRALLGGAIAGAAATLALGRAGGPHGASGLRRALCRAIR